MENIRRISVFLLGALILSATTPVDASFQAEELFVPSVGRGDGASGSFWYTSVWFHNPNEQAAVATVSLLLRDQANPSPEQQVVTIPARSTLSFEDALSELFGRSSAVGALRVQSTVALAVGARVFNQPGASISESQGQLLAGLPAGFAIGPGHVVEVPGILQPADQSFRSNFGLVEVSGAQATVEVRLLAPDSSELAGAQFQLGPHAAFQRSLASLAPDATVSGGILRFELISDQGAVLAYASAVANGALSQDPTTLDMTLDPSRVSIAYGITGIQAGPGLSGGGDGGDVSLQVVPGEGIAVDENGVSLAEHGIRAKHVAAGELLLGAEVNGELLHDVITLEAGNNVNLDVDGDSLSITAFGCFGERLELPVTQILETGAVGAWIGGGAQLELPAAGRWRVGFRTVVEVRNSGIATVSEPVNLALYDATEREIVRGSMTILGQRVDLNSSIFSTLSAEAVIEVDRATTLTLAVRSSRADLKLTVLPHDADLSPNLSAPDATSYIYRECIHLD